MTTADLELAASIIYRRCAGVPRFVTHAADFLQTGGSVESLGSNPFVVYLQEHAKVELTRYSTLPDKQKLFFIELIRLASLRVPFDAEAKIEGEMWGLAPGSMNLEICAAFPVYLERVEEKKESKKTKTQKASKSAKLSKSPKLYRLVYLK